MGNIYRIGRRDQQPGNHQPSIFVNNIQTKGCSVFKSGFQLVKKSIKIVNDPTNENIYFLNFSYYSTHPLYITIYYSVNETIEASTHLTKGFQVMNKNMTSYCYKCQAGTNTEFPQRISSLDVTKYSEKDLTTIKENYYPFIMKMEYASDTMIREKKPTMYTYGSFSKNDHGKFEFRLHKQKFELDGKVFEISDIYGIDSTQFNKEWNASCDGDRECTICFTDKTDTLLLPCKHMCLCQKCSEQVKRDSKRCPICRYEIELCITIDMAKGAIISEDPASPGKKSILDPIMSNAPNDMLGRRSLVMHPNFQNN